MRREDRQQTDWAGWGRDSTDRQNRDDRHVPLLAGPALPSPGEQLPCSEAFTPSSRKSSRSTSEAGITLCTTMGYTGGHSGLFPCPHSGDTVNRLCGDRRRTSGILGCSVRKPALSPVPTTIPTLRAAGPEDRS